MMRSVILLTLLLALAVCTASAQNRDTSICRLGFTYDISRSKSWGDNKPVIKSIISYLSVEQAGIKKYGVIEEINGVPVTEVSVDEIPQLLNPAGGNDVLLIINNLSSPSKQVLVKKDCKKSNAITEDQLASAYAVYSLETTNEQEFVRPFEATVTSGGVDSGNLKTFALSTIDESNRRLETVINECIGNELTKKGLTVDITKSDLLIQISRFFDKNPNYLGANKVLVEREPIYRYNSSHSKMEKSPLLNYAAAEAEAEYLLQFGICIIGQKDIPGRVLWGCEASKLLEDSCRLDEYARMHVLLMCMQYPYTKYGRNVPLKVSKKTYNYTRIGYDIDRLDQVVDVDRNPSAHAAGIRPHGIIEKTGRHKMDHSAGEFSPAYKRSITNTVQHRDPKTMFTDANGFKYCIF